MFSLFSKSKGPVVKDVVFMNAHGHAAAIGKWIQAHPEGTVAVWFHNDLEQLRRSVGEEAAHKCVLADRLSFSHPDPGSLLFAGHYPILSKEMELCEELGVQEMLVYTHLDAPFLKAFGTEQIKEVMTKMGMKEDEELTNPMISRAIKNAQDKMAKRVPADTGARSEEEWMRMNTADGV